MRKLAARMATILVLLAPALAAEKTMAAGTSAVEEQIFDAAIDTLCAKRVVVLGEDSGHGAGRTVALKGRITRALVERCGFSTIYFESPLYEFLHLQEQLDAGNAYPELLSDAIGPLWAGTREFQPTLQWLWGRVASGHLQVQGLDVQVGSVTQAYSAEMLPARLASSAGASQAACQREIGRLTRWEFDKTHPFDDAFRARLHQCLSVIQRNFAKRRDDAASLRGERMGWALSRALGLNSVDGFNLRDEAMALNLAWHQARSPSARIIVWTASSHAVKGPLPDRPTRVSLGMHLEAAYGNGLASIGFTAYTGHHGRPGQSNDLGVPTPASLEALQGPPLFPYYLGTDELHRIGPVESRVVAYSRTLHADWTRLLDGIWVLPHETPLDSDTGDDALP